LGLRIFQEQLGLALKLSGPTIKYIKNEIFLISFRAMVLSLNLCGFFTPPLPRADFLVALVASFCVCFSRKCGN